MSRVCLPHLLSLFNLEDNPDNAAASFAKFSIYIYCLNVGIREQIDSTLNAKAEKARDNIARTRNSNV